MTEPEETKTPPKPAEPKNAGSKTPQKQPPEYPSGYDTSEQPNDQVPTMTEPEAPEEDADVKAAPTLTERRQAAEKEEAASRAKKAAPKKATRRD